MNETRAQRAWRKRQQETREERMSRLRKEQRALYEGEPIHRPRVVGKPGKPKRRTHKPGKDVFFGSAQGGAPG